ncbi:MAG: hypothetical protein AAGC93_11885 [Cyanobacteria bacterium P01_F01_bin.53]
MNAQILWVMGWQAVLTLPTLMKLTLERDFCVLWWCEMLPQFSGIESPHREPTNLASNKVLIRGCWRDFASGDSQQPDHECIGSQDTRE